MATLSGCVQAVQAVSPALAGALLTSAWQGLLLAGGVGLALRFVCRVSPTVRASLWVAVLLLLLALPVLTLALHPHAGAPTPVVRHPGVHLAKVWSMGLLGAWAALSALQAVQLSWQAARLSGLAKRATPVAVEGELAGLLQGRRRATLCVSAEVNRPSMSGFLHPRVLLPAGLLQTLSPAELQQVVLHEMEHLRRGDDWWNLLQQVSLLLLPLQPALLWVDRQLCRERELACDDGVLAATREHKAYAACLVKLAEDSMRRKGVALALSALGTRARESELVRRVRRILAGPERPSRSLRTHLAVGVLGLVTMTCAGLLVRSPEWIQFDGGVQRTLEAKLAAPAAVPTSPRARTVSEPVARSTMRSTDGDGMARPVLIRAVWPQPTRSYPLTTKAGVKLSRSGGHLAWATTKWPVRKALIGRRATERIPQTRRPKNQESMGTTPPVTARFPEDVAAEAGVKSARLVVTEFEISQPVYAAVAIEGGWLVLQL